MIRARSAAATVAVALLLVHAVAASGPVGFYAIVDKVVFEPSEQAPERIQIWGAFAFTDPNPQYGGVSEVRRGYLYFKLPDDNAVAQMVKREWMDLKAVAGTGQAVGFGRWSYVGSFAQLDPSGSAASSGGTANSTRVSADLRVRPASEAPASPATHYTNAGLVKIPAAGSLADVVKRLRAAPRTP